MINYSTHEVVITGICKKKTGYLLSFPDGKPAGRMELPLPPAERKALGSILPQAKMGEDEQVLYLKPDIRCRVKARGLTRQGMAPDSGI